MSQQPSSAWKHKQISKVTQAKKFLEFRLRIPGHALFVCEALGGVPVYTDRWCSRVVAWFELCISKSEQTCLLLALYLENHPHWGCCLSSKCPTALALREHQCVQLVKFPVYLVPRCVLLFGSWMLLAPHGCGSYTDPKLHHSSAFFRNSLIITSSFIN